MLMGCVWIVSKHGASCCARSEGSISSAKVDSINLRTSFSRGWIGVLVMRCQNTVRSRTFCGSVAHGAAAVCCWPWMVSVVGAMAGSWLWAMFVSSYVPGTLALMGSPLPDVQKMMNCAFAAAAQPVMLLGSARAFRGLSKSETGSPVARARRPTQPAPNKVDSRASRRLIISLSSQRPMVTADGARQAATKVD